MLIWKFDDIFSFNKPLNVIFKTIKSILSGNSSHFSDTTSSAEQNIHFTSWRRIFLALSFFVFDSEEDQ